MRLATIPVDTARTADDPEGRVWLTIDPDAVYPAVIAYLEAALAGGPLAPTLRDILGRAQALDARAWDLARTPRDEADPKDLALRAQALELVRLAATELAHAAQGHAPIAVHIVKRPAWRD